MCLRLSQKLALGPFFLALLDVSNRNETRRDEGGEIPKHFAQRFHRAVTALREILIKFVHKKRFKLGAYRKAAQGFLKVILKLMLYLYYIIFILYIFVGHLLRVPIFFCQCNWQVASARHRHVAVVASDTSVVAVVTRRSCKK